MDTLYQSLVTVNPVTLIAQICNLFIQLLIVKIFFLDKIKAVLDKRREIADEQIASAENARAEAEALRSAYTEKLQGAKADSERIVKEAVARGQSREEEILRKANEDATAMVNKAHADIAMEKKKAINDAKNEISGLALAIAGKVVERELNAEDQSQFIDRFLDELGEGL